MNHETRILKSYSKVWKIERVFYQVGGFTLPNPIALNTFLYFMVFELILFLTRNVVLLNLIPGAVRYLIIPGGLAWLCNNKLLDGKNPISFVLSIFVHYTNILSRGGHINRYKYIKSRKGIAKYSTNISYRISTKN